VVEAGLVDLVASDHVVCPEVRLVATPGHTPGHVSILIESHGESALITGDFIHHPCQLAHPEWSLTSDHDQALSADTRERIFSGLAGTATLVIGTHWPDPTAGYVERDRGAYRLGG
jgi:glyoxylase-like metal-dependent hydrolase (beta-lactamase superfamily II)